MGKKFSRLVILLVAAIVVFHLGIVRSEDAAGSANTGLPQLQEAKTYKIPSSKTSTGIAGLVLGDAPTAVAWSPDGKRLAAFSSYGQNLTVWDAANGNVTTVLHPYLNYLDNSLIFLNDNQLLTPPEGDRQAPGERWSFNIWDIQSGSVVTKVKGPEPDKVWDANGAAAYAISPDGSMVATLAQKTGFAKLGPAQEFGENPVPIYSTKTWQITQSLPIVWPRSVAFSPDGKQIAFGTAIGKIIVYDTKTWQPTQTIHACDSATVTSELDYSPDSKFIVAGLASHVPTCAVQIFRVADGAMVGSYPEYNAGDPWKILWHPSGKFIVFAPHDKTLRLWNPQKPDDVGSIIRGVNSMCLAFSPDGKQLATCNNGGITVFNINF
jgi:WD40 repeat protein